MRSSPASPGRPRPGSCARCNRPRAGSTPLWMRTPKVRRASSTSGLPTRCAAWYRRTSTPPSRHGSGSTAARTSKARTGTCTPFAKSPTWARDIGTTEAETAERIDQALAALFEVRSHRIRPGRDDKILTSWNGLMIKGMATAGRILGVPELITSAERAVDFIRNRNVERWPVARHLQGRSCPVQRLP